MKPAGRTFLGEQSGGLFDNKRRFLLGVPRKTRRLLSSGFSFPYNMPSKKQRSEILLGEDDRRSSLKGIACNAARECRRGGRGGASRKPLIATVFGIFYFKGMRLIFVYENA